MRVSTLATMNCPRCAAPVKGDYKYCPECACRPRPEVRETLPEAGGRGPMVVVVSAILLVLAGILVGWKIVADRGNEVREIIAPPPRQFLEVMDFHDAFVPMPQGVAFYYRNENVLTEPPGAFEKILHRIPVEDRQAFLDEVAEDPAALARWGALLSFFYERSEDVLWKRTRQEPVYVLPFKILRYEVTRGQYKQFLLAVEKDPSLLSRLSWVRQLWWGEEGRKDLIYRARRYREHWWSVVLERHRTRDALRRERLTTEAFESGELVLANAEGISEEERKLRQREVGDEKFPAAPPPARPAWLGPSSAATDAAALRTMTPAQAVKLLVPPGWVRIDEDGAVRWSSDESTHDWPITDVSWWDAQMFIAWARKATGNNKLRLPTWAEWARAAHGGNAMREPDDFDARGAPGYRWPWGNKIDIHGCNNRNLAKNQAQGARPRDVRETYSWHGGRSPQGVLNMAGNAAEWTENIARYYRTDASGTLFYGRNPAEEALAQRALVCGGSFTHGLDDCKTTWREALFKTQRLEWVGFRLATEDGL